MLFKEILLQIEMQHWKPLMRKSLKHINPLRAPGSDAMQTIFYNKSWNFIGKYVCKLVKSFFTYDDMLKKLKRKYITLIYDVYIPYKIISKILVTRLKAYYIRLSHLCKGLSHRKEIPMIIFLYMKSLILFQKTE